MTAGDLSPADIPVVILCGGMGTRLREASEKLPKPLVDIGGRPILWHIMKTYSEHGFRRFVLALGYKSDLIKQYFLDYRHLTSDFTLHLGADRFALTYGDGIGDVDITGALRHHVEQGLLGTLTGVHPSSRYGEMRVEGDTVVEFNEKPTLADGWVNGGFFVFEREFVDKYLDDDPAVMLESAPLQQLARDRQLSVYEHEGFWMGMDTFRDWTELNGLWDAGRAPWKIWED